ncbi:MAG TPA: hypothetical protein VGA50_14370 [Kiloniellales bacterium]
MRGVPVTLAIFLLALSVVATGQVKTASAADPTAITKIKMTPLPIFESADAGTLIKQIEDSELAGLPLPWPILDASDNGMYLIEIEGQRVWVIDSTVKVDAMATGSAFAPEAMNFPDKDLAGSRGYGN